jgi:hypothetical protein
VVGAHPFLRRGNSKEKRRYKREKDDEDEAMQQKGIHFFYPSSPLLGNREKKAPAMSLPLLLLAPGFKCE